MKFIVFAVLLFLNLAAAAVIPITEVQNDENSDFTLEKQEREELEKIQAKCSGIHLYYKKPKCVGRKRRHVTIAAVCKDFSGKMDNEFPKLLVNELQKANLTIEELNDAAGNLILYEPKCS